MKILIVDDAAVNLYILETLLKGGNYEVVSAEDGLEALQRLRAGAFDMIISDILMPRMKSWETCGPLRPPGRRHLRATVQGKGVPV